MSKLFCNYQCKCGSIVNITMTVKELFSKGLPPIILCNKCGGMAKRLYVSPPRLFKELKKQIEVLEEEKNFISSQIDKLEKTTNTKQTLKAMYHEFWEIQCKIDNIKKSL